MTRMFKSVAFLWGRLFTRDDDFKARLMADLGMKR